MASKLPTQVPGDKMKKAIIHFSELLELKSDKPRKTLLQEVEIRFDLSPAECQFLHKHFSKDTP
jgi:hypothetical protein